MWKCIIISIVWEISVEVAKLGLNGVISNHIVNGVRTVFYQNVLLQG